MKFLAFVLLVGFGALANGAEMYRWIDEKGVVNYTPYPPPPNIRKVEPKKLGDSGTASASGMPYGTQMAVKNFPVTFYATPDCEPCTTARAHLDKRGIPYTDKNPKAASAEDFAAFKQLTSGGMELPLLLVGQLKTLKGYLAEEWDSALDAAGYPSSASAGAKPPAKSTAKPPAPAAPPSPPAAAK